MIKKARIELDNELVKKIQKYIPLPTKSEVVNKALLYFYRHIRKKIEYIKQKNFIFIDFYNLHLDFRKPTKEQKEKIKEFFKKWYAPFIFHSVEKWEEGERIIPLPSKPLEEIEKMAKPLESLLGSQISEAIKSYIEKEKIDPFSYSRIIMPEKLSEVLQELSPTWFNSIDCAFFLARYQEVKEWIDKYINWKDPQKREPFRIKDLKWFDLYLSDCRVYLLFEDKSGNILDVKKIEEDDKEVDLDELTANLDNYKPAPEPHVSIRGIPYITALPFNHLFCPIYISMIEACLIYKITIKRCAYSNCKNIFVCTRKNHIFCSTKCKTKYHKEK